MEEVKKLLTIADRLLGPGGCPWDHEQTLFTLEPYLLEETHELIEAIDSEDPKKIVEELGDVLYALVFIAKLGEKNNSFTFQEAVKEVSEKLIRRHPHVFGEVKVESSNDVLKNWDEIKKTEQASKARKTILDGFPPTLPIVARAQKVFHKLKRAKSPLMPTLEKKSEEEIGKRLLELVAQAECSGVDAESALRRACSRLEESYKEKNTGD